MQEAALPYTRKPAYSPLSLPGQSDTHPPSSTEVLQFLLLHSSAETQPMEDTRGPHLCLVRIQLLETLIQLHKLLTLGCEGKWGHIYYKFENQYGDISLRKIDFHDS